MTNQKGYANQHIPFNLKFLFRILFNFFVYFFSYFNYILSFKGIQNNNILCLAYMSIVKEDI